MLWLLQSARADCQALHLFFYAWTLFSLKSLLWQCTCAESSCLSKVAPDLHQWKSEEHQSTRALFSWPVWKRVNPNNTSLAGEAIQYLMYLFLLFFAVCACREAFSHVCYLIPCFLMPSLSDSLCFSVTLFKNGSNSSLLPSQRKGTTALLYWVNAFSHTCSWMGDYLNILNTLLIGIMTCWEWEWEEDLYSGSWILVNE